VIACLSVLGLVAPATAQVLTADECSAATLLVGSGVFSFNLIGASTSTDGQAENVCNFFGSPSIEYDVWAEWRPLETGIATISTCDSTVFDTKIAVYPSAPCSLLPAIACNDDSCELKAQVRFPVVAGSSYTLQIGTYPNSGPTSGELTLMVTQLPATCALDDSLSNQGVGLSVNGGLAWLQRYGVLQTSSVISSIGVAYGSPAQPGTVLVPDGLPVTVAIWDDPNEDGNPLDAVLLRTVSTSVAQGYTNAFNYVSIWPPLPIDGYYFIGASCSPAPGMLIAPLDSSQASMGRSYLVTNLSAPVDLQNLSANFGPPIDVANLGLSGVWMLRTTCEPQVGMAFCESGTTACPCANSGLPGHGCASSFNPHGAILSAIGTPWRAQDKLMLVAQGVAHPTATSFCIFAQSPMPQSPVVFGDGVQCLGSTGLIRLATRTTQNTDAAFGHGIAGDPDISIAGGITQPGVRHYQVFYRNGAMFCTLGTFNATNALTVVWY
jgi:hypothetical protein